VLVVEAGDGPPLVLQHGFPQDWRSWQAVIPILAERFRVICPDMRGFGESDAPPWGYDKEGLAQDLLAVCDALGVDRFALAGHDWGGVVCFIAALRAPERVERLILLNTAHGFWQVDLEFLLALRGFWYMPLIGAPLLGSRLIRTTWFQRTVLGWADPGLAWDPATSEAFLGPLRAQPARASASRRLYGRFVFSELAEMLRGRYLRERLTVPTLFLHGTADRAIRPAVLRGYEPHADDLRIELVPGAGHFLCDAEPELVAGRMIEFSTSYRSSRTSPSCRP
jgi:pimeloyl-ACP methyl ester carboxylesterase